MIRRTLSISILVVAILAVPNYGASQEKGVSKEIPQPPVVSMVQLIATPERFDGKAVTVIGFLRLEHEAYLLYLDKEDYDNVVLANALWVDATEEMGKSRDKLEMRYVKIVGTFRAGHEKRNLFSVGGLSDIKLCDFWSDPAHPLEERIKSMHH